MMKTLNLSLELEENISPTENMKNDSGSKKK